MSEASMRMGRPPIEIDMELACRLVFEQGLSIRKAAKHMGVHHNTLISRFSPRARQGKPTIPKLKKTHKASTYQCADCGAPRSVGSGQRCFGCYRKRVANNEVIRALHKQVIQTRREQRQAERALKMEMDTQARTIHQAERERLALLKQEERKALLDAPTRQGTQRATRRVSRDLLFQPFQFHFGSVVPRPSHAFKDALSLDAPFGKSPDRRFGGEETLADVAAIEATPNVIEKILEVEGVDRIVERVADEGKIPLSAARRVVETTLDNYDEIISVRSERDIMSDLRSLYGRKREFYSNEYFGKRRQREEGFWLDMFGLNDDSPDFNVTRAGRGELGFCSIELNDFLSSPLNPERQLWKPSAQTY